MSISSWSPAEVTELVKAVFFGVAATCVPIATVYTMISAARAKRSEQASLRNAEKIDAVSVNVDRLEKNTNSISERNQVIAQKLGITEGIAQERASIVATTVREGGIAPNNGAPVPVTDDRTAKAAERGAAANERIADAAEAVVKGKP